MPRITKFVPKPEKGRVWIYVDNIYCASVRDRTFESLNLTIGQEITCEKIKELENFAFKNAYSKTWKREAEKIEEFKNYLYEKFQGLIDIKTKGLGSGSEEMITRHAEENEKIDLAVVRAGEDDPIFWVELTGTDFAGLTEYWVRPDKVRYIQTHSEDVIWVVLLYPDKKIFIMPQIDKDYPTERKVIRGIGEDYVIFKDSHEEVKSEEEFLKSLSSTLRI